MRQMPGCAERAVGAKIKARKLAERRKLFMFFTPLKLKHRGPEQTKMKVMQFTYYAHCTVSPETAGE
jgi:hypothetical protein